MGRERSFSDVNHHGLYNVNSRTRRPSTIEGSDESISTDEADLEPVQCFLPVGDIFIDGSGNQNRFFFIFCQIIGIFDDFSKWSACTERYCETLKNNQICQ